MFLDLWQVHEESKSICLWKRREKGFRFEGGVKTSSIDYQGRVKMNTFTDFFLGCDAIFTLYRTSTVPLNNPANGLNSLNLRPNLKNFSRTAQIWLVPLKIAFNFSRFKSTLKELTFCHRL